MITRRRFFFSPILASLALTVSVQAQNQQSPDPVKLLEHIRQSAVLSQFELKGKLSKGRLKMPVHLFKRGENIQFKFGDKKDEGLRFHVRLDADPDLFDIAADGKTTLFPVEKLNEKIKNTDFTYEDLALRFLYWDKATIVGEEKINGYDCYKLKVENPSKKGGYGSVSVWVHKKYLALIRVDGFDFAGQRVRKFEITKVMKVGKTYTVEKMRVDSINAKTGRSEGVSYLTFENPRKKRKLGPR